MLNIMWGTFEKMNQLCKVCGEPAAGFHFGAFTCEGCKSFFGRTYNNITAISGCKNNGECVINKKNRTACKACRLRKCLLVGMSKSGSRYGRRSNWFKIHCLLQEQHTHQQQNQQPSSNNQSPISTSFDQFNFSHHHIQAKQTYQDKTNPSIKTASNLLNSSNNLLLNPFLPVQQLLNNNSHHNNNNNSNNNNNNNNTISINNQLCPTSKSTDSGKNSRELRGVSSSASDSGASSADPEENGSNSNKDMIHRDNSPHEIKFESIRSSSEPLTVVQPLYNGHNHHYQRNPFLTAFQHMQIPALVPIITGGNQSTNIVSINIQDEPIDLSTKSISLQKRCRTSSPPVLPPSATQIIKPAPLDLTLVRSQPMSG